VALALIHALKVAQSIDAADFVLIGDAAVGYPTLRLVRWIIGDWTSEGLQPGQWRQTDDASSQRKARDINPWAVTGGEPRHGDDRN
jgi:hypothetical protein